jgi:photosystem II stability/assembly factor-like uncharacterized protein
MLALGLPPLLTDVAFTSPQDGVVVTGHGELWHTGDGGATWQPRLRIDGAVLWQVHFSDPRTGMVLGQHACAFGKGCTGRAFFLCTVDGGATWQSIEPRGWSTTRPEVLARLNLVVLSPQVSFLVRDAALTSSAGRLSDLGDGLWRTDDGGQTWRELHLPGKRWPSGGLSFLSPWRGFVTTGDAILATEDGGQTWQTRYISRSKYGSLSAVQMLDARHGYAGGGWATSSSSASHQLLLATDDGGHTWRTVYEHFEERDGKPITRLQFSSPQTGWVAHGGCRKMIDSARHCAGKVRYTSDGGQSWHTAGFGQVLRFTSIGASAWFLDAGRSDALYHSGDGGRTWQLLRSHG